MVNPGWTSGTCANGSADCRGMLPGRETEPAGEVAGVALVADFANGGRNHGGGGQQTDAGTVSSSWQAGLCLASTAPRQSCPQFRQHNKPYTSFMFKPVLTTVIHSICGLFSAMLHQLQGLTSNLAALKTACPAHDVLY